MTVPGLFSRKFWGALVTGVAAGTVALITSDGDPTTVKVTLAIGAVAAAAVGFLIPNEPPGEAAEELGAGGRQTSTVRSARVRFSRVVAGPQEAVPRWLQISSPVVGIVTGILGSAFAYAAL